MRGRRRIALHVGRHGGPQTTEHDQKEEFVDAFSVVFDVEASGFRSDELRRMRVGLSEEVTEEEMNSETEVNVCANGVLTQSTGGTLPKPTREMVFLVFHTPIFTTFIGNCKHQKH